MRFNQLRNDRRGFALEATLMVMLLISVLLAAAVLGAVTTTRTTSLDYRNSRVFYAAEAATEAIMGDLGVYMEDGYLSPEELTALTPPTLEGFTFDSFSVTKTGDAVTETITDGSFAGLYALTQMVEIYSEARDATEAFALCEAEPIPIQLVVSDLSAPSLGRGVARRLMALRPELRGVLMLRLRS